MKPQKKPVFRPSRKKVSLPKPAVSKVGGGAAAGGLAALKHELEVHQIELEMQNEELRMAQSGLEAEARRYTELYDFAPVGYFTLEPDGTIDLANLTGAKLLGRERGRLLGKRFGAFVGEADRPVLAAFLAQVFATPGNHSCEVTLLEKAGQTKLTTVHIEAAAPAESKVCHAIVTDVSRHNSAARRIADALNFNQTMIRSSPVGLLVYDASGRCISANAAAEKIMGGTKEELLQQNFRKLKSWPHSGLLAAAETALAQQKEQVLETKYTSSFGREAWLFCRFTPFLYADQPHLLLNVSDITERRQLEQAALAAKLFTQATVDALPSHICVLDENGVILFTNLSWRQFADNNSAVPVKDDVGRNYLTLCENVSVATTAKPNDAADAKKMAAGIRAVMGGQLPKFMMEYPCHSETEQRWFFVSVTRFADATPIRVVVDHENITARKQVEQALQKSERRFMDMFYAAADALLLISDNKFVDCNEATAKMLGYATRQEFLHTHPSELSPPEQLDGRNSYEKAEEMMRIATERGYHRFEWIHRHANGEDFPVEVSLTPVVYEGKSLIYCIWRDIAKQKQVEESNQRLVVAIDQTAESIVFTDLTGTIFHVNQSFIKKTGYTLQEAVGQNPRLLKSGKQSPAFYKDLWKTISRGEVWRGRFSTKRKDGTIYEEDATISPIRNAAGKTTGYVAVKRDITHELQLEQQLFEVQKMESVGQLAGGVAHDYNNILAAMVIQLGMLLMDDSLPAEVREGLNGLKRGTDRATGLTRQLLMFSRRQTMQKKPVEFNALLDDEMKMLRRLLGENIELLIHSHTKEAWINADLGMIEQVIMNLCINARDAMPKGGRLVLDIRSEAVDKTTHESVEARNGEFICFSVADEGLGMSAEIIRRIFEPFFTTKEVGKGTGLGLSTVYGIVKQHEGWVEVSSEVNRGSQFRVYFPAQAAPKQTDNVAATAAKIIGGKETILIVEDEEGLRRVLASCLKFAGYQVFEAENGKEAVELWRARINQLDLLLTDMVMPGGLDGLETAAALQNLKPELPVVLMSGYSSQLVESGISKQPNFTFLSKPCDRDTLTKVVRQSLDTARIRGKSS